jgi:hypothetical protein
MLIMKDEKMYPRGSGVVGYILEASWRKGTQRKTLLYSFKSLIYTRTLRTHNRYIEPSKQVWVRPSTRRRGSGKK